MFFYYTIKNKLNHVDKFLKIKSFLSDALFPKFCLGCGREGIFLCQDCRHALDISEYNFCLCENNPQTLPPHSALGKCAKCQNKKLDGLYFALAYKEKPLTKKLIHQFKYQPYLKSLAPTLASILAEHFIKTGKNTNEVWQNSILIPVPLDKNKFNNRGYNQSEELAKELAKILKIPAISNYLIKTKPTKPQMELNKSEREKNLQNAFAIKTAEARPPLTFASKKVFLVDDVYTTGSTMQECAKVLKSSGVKQVWGIAIAREG